MSIQSDADRASNLHTPTRLSLIQHWLGTTLETNNFDLQYLAGDASFRRYARVSCSNKTYMLMDASPDQEDCQPFIKIDLFFAQHGVRVPQIIAHDLEHGFLLLEDFGDEILAQVLNPITVDQYYTQAFSQLIHLQNIAKADTVLPYYSEQKLIQEMRLFDEWMLPSLGYAIDASTAALLQESYHIITSNVLAQPQVVVHRDFHSRNLMVLSTPYDPRLGIIDFQDAVIGADSYDLVSLIRDAYVQWPTARVHQWIEQFYQLLPEVQRQDRTLAQFHTDVSMMSLQRHLKILGIFVRLYQRDGKSGYLKDLPRVMYYVRQQLDVLPQLQSLSQWIEQCIVPLFEQKYGTYTAITLSQDIQS